MVMRMRMITPSDPEAKSFKVRLETSFAPHQLDFVSPEPTPKLLKAVVGDANARRPTERVLCLSLCSASAFRSRAKFGRL